jgi:GNAT superfamily N-acetyltransferase
MTSPDRQAAVLDCHPVTPERWPDLVQLFEHHGNPGYCWCTRWRVPSGQFQRLGTDGREDALQHLVEERTPVGILGYLDGKPVGWCSVAPRQTYAALERSRALKRLDDAPVWSVVCFFVERKTRGQGVGLALLRAAVEYARSNDAQVVEGYPVEPGAASYTFMGYPSMFEKAGFRDAAPPGQGRRIMRYVVGAS